MLNLEVEVSREPVVEGRALDVARGDRLHLEPVELSVLVDVHRNVVRLAHPHKPGALQHAARKKCAIVNTYATTAKRSKNRSLTEE